MATAFHEWVNLRFIGLEHNFWKNKLFLLNQGANIPKVSFCYRDNMTI